MRFGLGVWIGLCGCSGRVNLADEGFGGGEASGGKGSGGKASGGKASAGSVNGGVSSSTGGVASGGADGGAGTGGAASGGAPLGSGGSGVVAGCKVGADQTCNDSLSASALWGHCLSDGSCQCNSGYELNPATGKCRVPQPVGCFSPTQNLDVAYDAGAVGCYCDTTAKDVCRSDSSGRGVALECVAGRWDAVEDGACAAIACTEVRSIKTTPTYLTSSFSPRVARMGSRFALTGVDVTASRAAFAVLDWDAQLHPQPVDPKLTEPFGLAALLLNGDESQLLVVDRVRTENPNRVDVRAQAFLGVAGTPAWGGNLLRSVAAVSATQVDLASSRDAQQVIFLHVDGPELEVQTLNPDFSGSQQLGVFEGAVDCARVIPTEHGGGVSVIHVSDATELRGWFVTELDAAGSGVFGKSVPMPTLVEPTCPQLAEGANGFHALWTSISGETVVMSMSRVTDEVGRELRIPKKDWPATSLGVLDNDFVLIRAQGDAARLERVNARGYTVAFPRTLPEPAREASIVTVEGRSVFVSYRNDSELVISEYDCP
ncbi:MAG: hypothetical protein QM756_02625 [Polyangiaceae bacterium]